MAEALIFLTCFMAASANAADGSAAPTVFVGKQADGQLEVFKLGPEGGLYHRWRKSSDGAWSSWSSLGGSLVPGVAIITNAEGQMEVFAVDRASHALACIRQLTTNSLNWSSWTNPAAANACTLDFPASGAHFVKLELRDPHGKLLSDNYFSLLPGETREFRIESSIATEHPEVGLSGWNIEPATVP